MAIAVRVGAGWTGDTAFVEVSGDARDAVSGQTLPEHPSDVWCCAFVGREAL